MYSLDAPCSRGMFLPLDLVQECVMPVGEPPVAAQLAAGGQGGQVGQEVSPQPLSNVAHSHRLRQRQLGVEVLLEYILNMLFMLCGKNL